MEGLDGRNDAAVREKTGRAITRARRTVKAYERVGVFYPGQNPTRLGHLGRLLLDLSTDKTVRRFVAEQVLRTLMRYQFDNPVDKSLEVGSSIHPYWATLKAATELEGKIHWDEINRELMPLMHDRDVPQAIQRIRDARSHQPDYDMFIGGEDDGAGEGLLGARAHPAKPTGADGKTSVGQLRDQKLTPFLRLAGFGGLLLEPPRLEGAGYWKVREDVADLVAAAVRETPEAKTFDSVEAWNRWFADGDVEGDARRPSMPALRTPLDALTLGALKREIARLEPKFTFSDEVLASVLSAMRSGNGRSFIILTGVSGTGKSALVRCIASALYGVHEVGEPWLTFVEVRPDWTDSTPLLGHFATIEGRYIQRKFLRALLAANQSPERPVIVCLDEMNLSRVENYLAEFLSAMESGLAVEIDRRTDRSVEPSVKWPGNLYLFGTINSDETTNRVSDKVLDRAQVIDTSHIDIRPILDRWLDEAMLLEDAEKEVVRRVVRELWTTLFDVDAHFGFRTGEAIVRFIDQAKASSDGVLDVNRALDAQVKQKILVKLRGEGERWEKPLRDLETTLSSLGEGARSASTALRRMQDDLRRFGAFQA